LFKYIEELQEILEEKFSKDAHEIREIRNLLHPGRVIRTKKVLKNRKKDYLKIYKKIQRISEQLLETI
jgi:phosphate uptake regulator